MILPNPVFFFFGGGGGGVGVPYLLGTLELRMRDPDRNRDQIGTLTKHNMDKLV